jgi:hypothetical protein
VHTPREGLTPTDVREANAALAQHAFARFAARRDERVLRPGWAPDRQRRARVPASRPRAATPLARGRIRRFTSPGGYFDALRTQRPELTLTVVLPEPIYG